jgi:hypothetical protein
MGRRWWKAGAVCAGVALGCVLLGGCGKSAYQVAQVSGKVTLDGKGVPNLVVGFSPAQTDQTTTPGPGSSATTNDDGQYELTLVEISSAGQKKMGAVVGKHTVMIVRFVPPSEGDVETRLAPDPVLDPLLAKFRKQVDVPPGGTKDMNFELKQ